MKDVMKAEMVMCCSGLSSPRVLARSGMRQGWDKQYGCLCLEALEDGPTMYGEEDTRGLRKSSSDWGRQVLAIQLRGAA